MKRPYASIYDWMERTGTDQTTLAKLAVIKRSFLCRILTRGRRCSLENALKLSAVSGVPVEKLFPPKTRAEKAQTEEAA